MAGKTGSNRRAHQRVDFVGRITAPQVNEYGAFTAGDDGHITASRAFVCANDEDAMVWAKQLIDGYDVELWRSLHCQT